LDRLCCSCIDGGCAQGALGRAGILRFTGRLTCVQLPPALDFYLKPTPEKETSDTHTLFIIAPDVDSECLLANLSENLASANAMISDLAFDLEGSRRHVALGIQQVIELSELLANRALDIVEVI